MVFITWKGKRPVIFNFRMKMNPFALDIQWTKQNKTKKKQEKTD